MKNLTLLAMLCLISFLSCTPTSDNAGAEEAAAETKAPLSEEEKAINQAVKNAYAAISFEEGTSPDYEALRALFTPEATLYNFRGDSLNFFYIDKFVEGFKAGVEGGEMSAFNEVELGGETEYFGQIGHRISAYASYFNGAEEVGERGVNSFQLLKKDGQWLINSIIWDIEKEGQPIPERYLRKE